MHFRKPIRLDHAQYSNPENAFHLVLRSHPEIREFTWAVRKAIWDTVLEQRSGSRVTLLAACLMPDHLHIVVKPGPLSVLEFLDRWKSWTTRLAWSAGHKGPLWQPSAWDRAIRDGPEFGATINYVLRNPVDAGLVNAWEEWPHTFVTDLD